MWLLNRFQFNLGAWSIPLACALFGSGLGISRALLACDLPSKAPHVAEYVENTDAEEQCDEDLERHLADLDGDGSVDVYDLVLFFADFGLSGPVAGDINDDGVVDRADFTALIYPLSS